MPNTKEDVKKAENTENQETEAQVAPEETKAEAKLAPGLFSGFSLGATLKQTPVGNSIVNIKTSPIDYEQVLRDSDKNVKMSPEQVKEASKPTK